MKSDVLSARPRAATNARQQARWIRPTRCLARPRAAASGEGGRDIRRAVLHFRVGTAPRSVARVRPPLIFQRSTGAARSRASSKSNRMILVLVAGQACLLGHGLVLPKFSFSGDHP